MYGQTGCGRVLMSSGVDIYSRRVPAPGEAGGAARIPINRTEESKDYLLFRRRVGLDLDAPARAVPVFTTNRDCSLKAAAWPIRATL